MLLSILQGGDPKEIIVSLLLSLPVILFALSLHETAHGYVAYKCGDPTAHNLGRLTLNPIKHFDLIGSICMLVFGFGWAKPVPINTRNFRNPKRGMILSAAAGPASNLILGIVSAILFGASSAYYSYLFYTVGEGAFLCTAAYYLTTLFLLGAYYNFFLATFNLIPIPPFDGSRIMLGFLPTNIYFKIMRYERQIMYGILIALLVLSYFDISPFGWIADKLTYGVGSPVSDLLWESVFLPMLKAK